MTSKSIKHLINISDLEKKEIISLLDRAQRWSEQLKQPSFHTDLLKGKILLTAFFENSTRTRTSFEFAARRLGAEIINWDVKTSSTTKGESFLDTVQTLAAMEPDALIMRHSEYNAPAFVAERVPFPVINAGDSYRAHPTQALLDALTIRQMKGRIEGLTIAICGDISHSRVANSNLVLFHKLGVNIHVIAPETLMPYELIVPDVKRFHSLEEGLKGCDVVMMLRIQKERMQASQIPDDSTYFNEFGLTREKLAFAKDDAIIMHPGPMNRGIEIDFDLPDDPKRSVILRQVANGIPVRMAVLERALT